MIASIIAQGFIESMYMRIFTFEWQEISVEFLPKYNENTDCYDIFLDNVYFGSISLDVIRQAVEYNINLAINSKTKWNNL